MKLTANYPLIMSDMEPPGLTKEEKDIMWDILVSDKPKEVLKYIVELMKTGEKDNIMMAKEALK